MKTKFYWENDKLCAYHTGSKFTNIRPWATNTAVVFALLFGCLPLMFFFRGKRK